MDSEKRKEHNFSAAGDHSGISLALKEAAACISEKQVEKVAAFCDVKGLKKVFCDAELMRTAECFISCSLNISAAARELYMHRNTMMYRLDKIKRSTGLDIRSFADAVAFRLLYAVYAREHNQGGLHTADSRSANLHAGDK